MSLFKPSVLITDIRNKTGNVVFSKSRQGNTIRSLSNPVNRHTGIQQARRITFGTASKLWGQFTPAQIAEWNTIASGITKKNVFGDIKNISGFNYFMRLCQIAATIGQPAPTVPFPVVSYPLPKHTIVDNPDEHLFTISLSRPLAAGEYIIFKCSKWMPVGRSSWNPLATRVCAVFNSATTFPRNLLTDIINFQGNSPVDLPYIVWKVIQTITYNGEFQSDAAVMQADFNDNDS
jgi:hypothetical protein